MLKHFIGTSVEQAPLRDLKASNNAGHYVKAQHSKTVDSSSTIFRIVFGVSKKQAISEKVVLAGAFTLSLRVIPWLSSELSIKNVVMEIGHSFRFPPA